MAIVFPSVPKPSRKKKKKKTKGLFAASAIKDRAIEFTLGSDVDESKSQAKFENGVLELTLPKKNGNTAK